MTNLSTSLRTLTVEADTLIVGAFAGTSAAGFYFIAKRLAKVAQQIGAHVQAVIYPDVARMWARGDIATFARTTRQVQTVLAACGLVGLLAVWLLGGPALRLVFGTAYADAFPLLATQVLAVVFILHSAPSRSSLLAMDRPGFVLGTMAVGVPLFVGLAIVLVMNMGAIGASWAHVALAAFTALVLALAVRSGTRDALVPGVTAA